VLRQLELVAPTDANVLVLGESGTGKELIARAIHERSPRSGKPMVKVNCGSIPRELFESEFFGHVRGAFTGAVKDRVGRFQLADGGTLFLDEVGEIPVELQPKLLRVLQEGEFERVGEEFTRHVNVRVIAATNRDLRQEVAAGRFRLDLFYRLGVFPMEVPPLRERREDIPELAAQFVRQACARFHVPEPRLPQREIERAQRYAWPGNVRELQNVTERAVILAAGGALQFELPDSAPAPPDTPSRSAILPGREVIPDREFRRLEEDNIRAALRLAGNRVSGRGGAAELLGVHPSTLASRLKVLGIR
jgi:transcriptional regulator with GAF, ATPase, and Fis domain